MEVILIVHFHTCKKFVRGTRCPGRVQTSESEVRHKPMRQKRVVDVVLKGSKTHFQKKDGHDVTLFLFFSFLFFPLTTRISHSFIFQEILNSNLIFSFGGSHPFILLFSLYFYYYSFTANITSFFTHLSL